MKEELCLGVQLIMLNHAYHAIKELGIYQTNPSLYMQVKNRRLCRMMQNPAMMQHRDIYNAYGCSSDKRNVVVIG